MLFRSRLMTIKDSCIKLKKEAKLLTKEALTSYTLASQGLALVSEILKLDTVLPPMGNVLISNVPGPKEALYLMGAEMQQCYPISVLPPGMSLNITLYSYNNSINVGLISCRSAMPDLTNLASFITEAFIELESAVLSSAALSVSEQISRLSFDNYTFDIKQESVSIINSAQDVVAVAIAPKTDTEKTLIAPKMGITA